MFIIALAERTALEEYSAHFVHPFIEIDHTVQLNDPSSLQLSYFYSPLYIPKISNHIEGISS